MGRVDPNPSPALIPKVLIYKEFTRKFFISQRFSGSALAKSLILKDRAGGGFELATSHLLVSPSLDAPQAAPLIYWVFTQAPWSEPLVEKNREVFVREAVLRLWPEIEWISDARLREQVTETWIKALERSPLKPDDLKQIPFTLLVPNCPITFMEHKRCVVHIARESAKAMTAFMGRALPIDLDVVIAGAILADVGKLLEYEMGPDGKSRQSERGEALRHPFTGVALALECGVPDAVCHIIAAHAAEGDLVKRTTEAFIVHHADFMAFLPFKNPKNVSSKFQTPSSK